MNYITIEARTYEEAVKKARNQYGDRLRIHSRRDKQSRGLLGLGVSRSCEITCFLTDEPAPAPDVRDTEEDTMLRRFEKEAITPDPKLVATEADPLMEQLPPRSSRVSADSLLSHIERILLRNDFTASYISWMLREMKTQIDRQGSENVSEQDAEAMLAEKIIGSAEFDYKDQKKPGSPMVLLGSEYSGKTTTIAKIAAMYLKGEDGEPMSVALSTMNPAPSASEQLKKIGSAFNIPVSETFDEPSFRQFLEQYSSSDLILIDTAGQNVRETDSDQKMYNLFNGAGKSRFSFFLVIPSSMKSSDIANVLNQFRPYSIRGLIVTMADQTTTIGNILSVSREKGLPLLYVTDGRKIPRDIKMASASFIAGNLKGFSIDAGGLVKQVSE